MATNGRLDDISLGRIAGVEVGLSWGLVAMGALFASVLALGQYPRAFPGYHAATYWLVSALAMVLFVGSVLVHELGHAIVARNEDVGVERVTLWMFGGLARLTEPPRTAGAEARIALAGPSATGMCAGVFWLLATIAGRAAHPSLLQFLFDWLSRTNLALLALNLVPALPLDGGRVTAAALWQWSGSRAKGTRYAARAGWAVGGGLALAGAILATDGRLVGMWALAVGALVVRTSRLQEAQESLQRAWRGRTAAELMLPSPPVAEDWMNLETVALALGAHPHGAAYRLCPVRAADGRTVGVLRLAALDDIPAAQRRQLRVLDVADPLRSVPIVSLHAPVDAIVADHPEVLAGGVLVAGADGRAVGVLGPDELLAARSGQPRRRAGR